MRPACLPLLFLALVVSSGSAAACTRVDPEGFSLVQWVDDDLVLTQDGHRVGLIVPGARNATTNVTDLDALVQAFPRLAAAVTTDGRWLVHGTGGEDPRPYEGNTCAVCYGITRAIDLHTNATLDLLDGPARVVAASATHVAVAHASLSGIHLYEAANWSDPVRVVPTRGDIYGGSTGGDPFMSGPPSVLAFSPNGRLLAMNAPSDNEIFAKVVLYDVDTGRVRSPAVYLDTQDDVEALAWSPDGDHLAVVTGRGWRESSSLHLVRVPGAQAEPVKLERLVHHADAAAWGPAGLAVALQQPDTYQETSGHRVIQLFPDAPDLVTSIDTGSRYQGAWSAGGMDWSPNGTHLLTGHAGMGLILDADLAEVSRILLGESTDLRHPASLGPCPSSGWGGERPSVVPAGHLLPLLVAGALVAWARRR